ncbi:MAG TPA: type II toxin-antitoxin system VapC family toxin [Candidatus Acidoferrum sp.]|nr:type II toxin-antitoxin system VapC family toxin [Candidatus Acidoferrum sp.]
MRLLLDTVALIFAVESPERLTKRAAGILQNTENILELSAISLSEIAIKAARGKLKFSAADIRHALEDLDIRVLPYTAKHAFFLFDLPAMHADPFDRQIIAQALSEEIPVITCDEKFSLYKGLKVLW